jgi:hypothetical protein
MLVCACSRDPGEKYVLDEYLFMLKLSDSLEKCQPGSIDKVLKRELESLPAGSLPLEKCINRCGIIDDSNISVTVINTREYVSGIQARIGVFFTEIVAGCVCGDEPTPENAYCEMLISIDRSTGEAKFELILD